MKLICRLLLLQLLLSSQIQAADLLPTQIEPLERDLARPFVQAQNTGDLTLGLGFEEGADYALDPALIAKNPSRSIDRKLKLSLRLPLRFELGFSLRGHQESMPESIAPSELQTHPLALVYWTRWYLVQSETWRTAILLQYEPGTGKPSQFHQPNQDKTSLALVQEYSPLDWLHGAVYAQHSQRKDEIYLNYQIKQESAFGARLVFGPAYLHGHADIQSRSLSIRSSATNQKASHLLSRIGVGSSFGAYDLSASAAIPASKAALGVPAESFSLQASYHFGAKAQKRPQDDEREEKSAQAHKAVDVPIPNMPTAASEADEFQLLEKQLETDSRSQQKESLSEQAERELQELRLQKEKDRAAEEIDQKRRQIEDDQAVGVQLEEDEKRTRAYKDEINEELDQYALPDAEELNWNGLRP